MSNGVEFPNALELINSSNNILLTTHIRPDGDACGSVRAMKEVLQSQGKKARALFMSPLADWYRAMFQDSIDVLGNDVTQEQLMDGYYQDCDLVIIVDTNSEVQLPGFSDWLKIAGKKVLVFDHHVTSDNLGDVEVVDASAAAAGEIVYDFIKYSGWPISERMAEAIFVALSSDTGWFKFGNADSRIFHTAAELIDAGARPNVVYAKLYQGFRLSRIRLMTRMLEHLELHAEGQIATQYIFRKDFDETGASGPDTENLIDECQRIKTVEAAALFVELSNGGFRCSLRSKGRVNVRKIAQKYGGGGHTLASGVNLENMTLDEAIKTIVTEAAEQLAD